MIPRRTRLQRLLAPLAVMALFATVLFGPGLVGVASAHVATARAASTAASTLSPDGDPLLLVHGFTDTCEYAFNRTNSNNTTDSTTVNYLTHHGWDPTAIDQIGYYGPSFIVRTTLPSNFVVPEIDATPTDPSIFDYQTGQTARGYCTNNLQELGDQAAVQKCSNLLGSSAAGTFDDPLEHLGCLLAWYIYDTYGSHPVDILAHSMGGLIVRDAIGESGHTTPPGSLVSFNNQWFPPKPLNVHVVVTVGTPHGGVGGEYWNLAQTIDPGPPQELADMETASFFQYRLSEMGEPQGLFTTYWALMASSVPCDNLLGMPVTAGISCDIENAGINTPFPDGDGVVQADSALSMPADFKIVYGDVNYCTSSGCSLYHSGGSVQYSHEANTCYNYGGPLAGCLNEYFYLNDGASGSTKAFVCQVNCTTGFDGMTDMALSDYGGTQVLRSLAEIVSLLTSRGPGIYFQAPQPTHLGYAQSFNLDEFGIATDGNLYHITNTATSGNPTWGGGWFNIGVPPGAGGPPLTVLSYTMGKKSDGREYIFATSNGSSPVLWYNYQTTVNGGVYSSNWTYIPNPSFSVGISPAVSVINEVGGRLAVFAIGTDGHLYETWEIGNGWAAWQNLGGALLQRAGALTVGRNPNGALDVFALDTSRQAWHKWQTVPGNDFTLGGTDYWALLGGSLAQITLAKEQDGRLDLFALGTDGHVWNNIQTSPGDDIHWTTWNRIGGSIQSFTVGTEQDGRLEVFAIGSDKQLWHKWEPSPNAAFPVDINWALIPGGGSSNFSGARPDVGNLPDGRLDVLAIDNNGNLWQNYQMVVNGGTNNANWSTFNNLAYPRGFPLLTNVG